MENLLLQQVVRIDEVQRAAAWQKEKRACILTGLAGSSKPVFFAAMDKILQEKGSLAFRFLFWGKYGLVLVGTGAGYALALRKGCKSLEGMNGDIAGYALTIGEMCGAAVYALL